MVRIECQSRRYIFTVREDILDWPPRLKKGHENIQDHSTFEGFLMAIRIVHPARRLDRLHKANLFVSLVFGPNWSLFGPFDDPVSVSKGTITPDATFKSLFDF